MKNVVALAFLAAALAGGNVLTAGPRQENGLTEVQSAVNPLQEARDFLSRGDYSAAREAARTAAERDAKSAEARYLIGAAELALNRLDDAQVHFGEALALMPRYLEARRGLGATYLKRRRFEEAANEFIEALKVKPDDFVALYSLGLAYLLQDRSPQALEQFERAHRINSKEAGLLIAMLQARVKLKQRSSVENTVGELTSLLDARDPRRLQIAFLLGAEGFYDLAIKEYENLRQIYPQSGPLSFNLALARHRLNQDAEAAKVLEEALARGEDASLWNLYGEIQEARRLRSEAVAAYRRAADLEPQKEDYQFDYAQSLVQSGSIDEALKVFAKAAKDFPASPRMLFGRGAAQYVKGDYEQAAQTFLRAADLAPQAAEAYALLGRVYDAANPSQQTAIEQRFGDYLKTPTRGDARAEYYYGKILAIRARQQGASPNLTAARQHLEKALALDKNFAAAHLELGNMLFEQNQFAESRTYLERAAALAPTAPDVFYRLSRLYARIGERALSQDALKKFQQLKARQGGTDAERNEMMKYLRGDQR